MGSQQLAWISSRWTYFKVSMDTHKAKSKTSPAQEGIDFHPLPACAGRGILFCLLSPTPQQQVPASQGSMPQILKLHLIVVPRPHPRGWSPTPSDRNDKEAFPSILATPDLMERKDSQALRCSVTRLTQSSLGLFSPRLSADGRHCGQRKGTRVLRVKGLGLAGRKI